MKVFFYTNNINPTFGGSVFSQLILAKEFSMRGAEVKIIVNRHHDTEIDPGVPVIALDAKYGDLQRPLQLKKMVQLEKPDAIFANMKPQMITLGLARLLTGKSETIFAGIDRMADHGLYLAGKLKYIPKRFFTRFAYGKLDHIVAISEFVRNDIHETYWLSKDKMSVIYNAVELDEIRAKAEQGLPDKDAALFDTREVMINVGRLTTQKAQHHLINVLAFLKDKRPNLDLVILGEGRMKDDLKKLAAELGIADRVHLLGHRDNPFSYIARAKLFALSSIHEAFGRVVLESMALRTPVIAFDAPGGHVELLSDGAGVIVPNGDELKYADSVLNILTDTTVRNNMIENACDSSNNFTSKNNGDAFYSCVEELMQKNT